VGGVGGSKSDFKPFGIQLRVTGRRKKTMDKESETERERERVRERERERERGDSAGLSTWDKFPKSVTKLDVRLKAQKYYKFLKSV
jgi:hypothetical protein